MRLDLEVVGSIDAIIAVLQQIAEELDMNVCVSNEDGVLLDANYSFTFTDFDQIHVNNDKAIVITPRR